MKLAGINPTAEMELNSSVVDTGDIIINKPAMPRTSLRIRDVT